MKIDVGKLDQDSDVLALGMFEGGKLSDDNLMKEVRRDSKLFSGKYGEKYSTRQNEQRVIILGLGDKKEITLEKLRRVLGKAIRCSKDWTKQSLSTDLVYLVAATGRFKEEKIGQAAAEGLELANYDFNKYLSKERLEKKSSISSVNLFWDGNKSELEKGIKIGKVVADASNFVRDLVNDSANVVTSEYLEKVARNVAKSNPKIKITVLDKSQLEKLEMGALLGVNAGSKNPPKLVIVEYNGGSGRPTAFVGKGITFDSGGYNLKPTKYIEDMKTDMAGAAAALGALKAAADLGLKRNLIAVMGLCENMVSSMAQHPGDIIRAYNGKTIEIGNTDAEGRLVLADALAYTEAKYKPEIMIDMATLTGACVVALGYYAAGMVSKDEELLLELKLAGLDSGDNVWPLPFFDDYQDWMDGSISDLNNISMKGKGYEAGSITAGVFLSKFVDTDKTRWVHLDIAGSAYWAIDGDYIVKGATGSGVRILVYWLLGHKDA
ncbi:MAG TPA: leucyl aminopeptidase [Candidatus Nanoarchaeia archaeon]|nr:leucyl aminopeptidase [Candidatus Nanoarchaeia archaeon]